MRESLLLSHCSPQGSQTWFSPPVSRPLPFRGAVTETVILLLLPGRFASRLPGCPGCLGCLGPGISPARHAVRCSACPLPIRLSSAPSQPSPVVKTAQVQMFPNDQYAISCSRDRSAPRSHASICAGNCARNACAAPARACACTRTCAPARTPLGAECKLRHRHCSWPLRFARVLLQVDSTVLMLVAGLQS